MNPLRLVWRYGVETIVVVLMAVMVITLAIQVFMRFVIQDPPSWTEELARYVFVWITFLGAAVAIRHGTHIVIDTMLHLLPMKVRTVLVWVVDVLVFIALVTLLIQGIAIAQATANTRATMLQVPMFYIYGAIPVGAALMLAFHVEAIVTRLRRHETGVRDSAIPGAPVPVPEAAVQEAAARGTAVREV